MPTPSPTPDEQAAYQAVLAAAGQESSASLQLVLDGKAVAVPTGAVVMDLLGETI